MIAVSILKEYNANHAGKLDEYIRLHICRPGSGFAWIFKDEWAGLAALHPNSLPLECPDMIFNMMSTLLQPRSIGPISQGYPSVDSRAPHLHAPVSQGDTDHGVAHGVAPSPHSFPDLKSIPPEFQEYPSLDSRASYLHAPVSQGDTDYGVAHGVAPSQHFFPDLQPIPQEFQEYPSVDSRASHLHAPVLQEDTDDGAAHEVHCPTAAESLGLQASRFLAYPVDVDDYDWSGTYLTLPPMKFDSSDNLTSPSTVSSGDIGADTTALSPHFSSMLPFIPSGFQKYPSADPTTRSILFSGNDFQYNGGYAI
jgi:hypothetical protein